MATLFYLIYLFVAVQAAPVHQLEGEALEVAESNGFLSNDYDRLHVIRLSEKLDDSLHPLDTGRIRSRRETQETTKIHVPINGVNYSLSLQHPQSVLHPNAEIIVADGSNSEEIHRLPARNCHLVGGVDGHQGSASLSYCDKLHGSMVVGDVEYVLAPLEDGQHVVAERSKPTEWLNDMSDDEDIKLFSPQMVASEAVREPRSSDQYGEPVVVEMAVYTDAAYTELLNKAKADTVQKKVDFLISKFNGVQYEYSKVDQLKKVVIFQIKKMVFFKTDPSWLSVSSRLGSFLSSLCQWNKDKKPYDIVYMITGHQPISPVGLAWVGGSCRKSSRCGVSMGTSWGRYVAIAHEIGHLLGMKHDSATKCKSASQIGLMGGKGTDFSKCSVEDFHKHLQNPNSCLLKQNIPDDEIMPELKGVVLKDIPMVVNVTHHQYCEKEMGPGYRYRERENMMYSCDSGYYCIQLKDGPEFGLIHREPAQGIVGMYCAPGKVCLKKQCLTYKLMTLHSKWIVIKGGWGEWSDWTTCSRTCGTGIRYRHRECNNPTPVQSEYCKGSEYKAEICNVRPCIGDSSDRNSIIKKRADETCKRLVEAKALNPEYNYKKTGRLYGVNGYIDQCDVHCDNDKSSSSRDAILPDGTPCRTPDPQFKVDDDTVDRMKCFRGKCQVFGCDGKFPATVYGSHPQCKDGSSIIG